MACVSGPSLAGVAVVNFRATVQNKGQHLQLISQMYLKHSVHVRLLSHTVDVAGPSKCDLVFQLHIKRTVN